MSEPRQASLLRLVICGSVDDGKSTLLGRLLLETGSATPEELDAAEGDLSRLVDGLEAEREQGITIDVAWRYFGTPKRRFIVADAPGHPQYTRNLVTAASTADLALVLVDATGGVLEQTRRHAYLCRLLGVRKVVLAVNKMDLAGFDADAFAAIVEAFGAVDSDFTAIPLSAAAGDNVVRRSEAMDWYSGPTLLDILEAEAPEEDARAAAPFRMPVQWVSREGFRGFSGLVASGTVRPGDLVRVMPSRARATVERVLLGDVALEEAVAGQSVTLAFAGHVDCARGDVIAADPLPEVADQFEATMIWMGEEELLPGRQYVLKLGTQEALATLQPPRHAIDIATLEPVPARTLALNEIGLADLWTDRPLVFAPYQENRALGGFILIDRVTNDTVGAGLIRFALRRSHNIHPQDITVTREARAAMKGQKARLLWFTGLSGAGKSTIANLVEKKLHAMGRHSYLLDGDNVRLGLNRDLGFSDADRAENVRRVGETAKLMLDAGLIVLAAFISPFRAERRMVREMLAPGEFVEIFVDTTLAEAERRDPKGLYAKARAGQIPNFTGIGSPYEAPEAPELRVDTNAVSPEEAADEIVRYLTASCR
ncbi:MAG TPA: adenylyl-sulfate kinase [Allosphingosinicella sp.]|jgi:bifunctional enzyme CysN/CysC